MSTRARILSALRTLRWSQNTLAAVLDVSDATIRRWLNGTYTAPEPLLAWLDDLARYVKEHPPPPPPDPSSCDTT